MNIPQPQSQGRITSPSMSVLEVVVALMESNMGAAKVLTEVAAQPMGQLCLLAIDNRRLYGSRIWQLYELCDCDIERFVYHVELELPNQVTGVVSVTNWSEYGLSVTDIDDWLAKRQFGRPGSFWALENPPTEPDYAFPIE